MNGGDDDDEPYFRVCFHGTDLNETKEQFWAEYNRSTRTWSRICLECTEKVCELSFYFCKHHSNKENKIKRNIKQQLKRLNQRLLKTNSLSLNTMSNRADETNTNAIVISVSSSLNKKQISLIKEFIRIFNNSSLSIHFTCETQPDYIDESTTHLITNDIGSYSTNLTKQILQACVRHIFIGSIEWISSSIEQSKLLDHFPFEILRERTSSMNTRGIKQCRFDQLPLFPSSYRFSLEFCREIKQLQMTRDELSEIIELAGASLVQNPNDNEKIYVICQTKKEMITMKRTLMNNINDERIVFCQPDFIFHSIVRHELQLIENYLW